MHPLFLFAEILGYVCANENGTMTECEKILYAQSPKPLWGVAGWYPLRGIHGHWLYLGTHREIVFVRESYIPETWQPRKTVDFFNVKIQKEIIIR